MSKPTPEQMEHFYDLQKRGIVTRANFQVFLEDPSRLIVNFGISYDPSLGLMKLIEQAVGEGELDSACSDITAEHFPLRGTGIRTLMVRVEPCLNDETIEQAAARLTEAGHRLASTGDLVGFLHDHPQEVAKWAWVLAISEDSRWTGPDDRVYVPHARVTGTCRSFNIFDLRRRLFPSAGILVLSE